MLKEGEFKLHITYPFIYLIALPAFKRAGIRVANRQYNEKGELTHKPAQVYFAGNRVQPHGQALGTLVVDEAMWTKWFGNREKLPHMDTAEKACRWIVKNNDGVFYGCPLCDFRTKDYENYKAHMASKDAWLLKQFDIIVELIPKVKLEEEVGD